MRTLKKTLCMVLALVMVLGFCAFSVAAADFSDAEEITYTEAVGVMAAAEILKGYEDGTFRPDGTLNRAEAATIITKMMGFDGVKGTAPFTDVPDSHWASSYIAFCVSEGIVAGYGDGTFGPSDTLTGSQWAKMVICAMGYNAAAEGISGSTWEIAVAKKVRELGLADTIADFDGTAPIDRETACELAFAGMNKGTVKYTPGITVNGVEIPGKTSDPDGATLLQQLGLKATPAAELGIDDYGRPIAVEYKNKNGLGDVVFSQTATAVASYTKGFDSTNKTDICKTYDFSAVTTNDIYVNGEKGFIADVDALFARDYVGTGIELFTKGEKTADGKLKITSIVVEQWYLTEVHSIASNGTVTLYVLNPWAGGDYQVRAIAKTDDAYEAISGYAKGDLFLTAWNGADATGTNDLLDVADSKTVEGKITKSTVTGATFDGSITMDGTVHTLASGYAELTDFGGAVTLDSANDQILHLDNNGYVIGITKPVTAATPDVYVYVVTAYDTQSTKDTGYGIINTIETYVQCVNMDGEEVNYLVGSKTDGATQIGMNKTTAGGAAYAGKLLKVTQTYDTTLKTKLATFDATDIMNGFLAKKSSDNTNVALTTATVQIPAGTSDTNRYYYDNVKFIYVSGTLGGMTVTVKTGAQNVAAGKAIAFVPVQVGSTTNYKVAAVFIADTFTPPVVTEVAYIYGDAISTKTALVTDADGNEATGYLKTIYVAGEKKEVYVTAATALTNGYYDYSEDGEIAVLISNTDGNLLAATAVTNMFNGMVTTGDVTNKDITNATFVNLTSATVADATELIAGDQIAIVLDSTDVDNANAVTVYLVSAAARS